MDYDVIRGCESNSACKSFCFRDEKVKTPLPYLMPFLRKSVCIFYQTVCFPSCFVCIDMWPHTAVRVYTFVNISEDNIIYLHCIVLISRDRLCERLLI